MSVFRGKNWIQRSLGKLQQIPAKLAQVKNEIPYEKLTSRTFYSECIRNIGNIVRTYKIQCLKGVGTLGLVAALSVAGHQYVESNMNDVYHVTVGGKEVGTISDEEVLNLYVVDKSHSIQEKYPNVDMILNVDQIDVEHDIVFRGKSNDKETLKKLDKMLTVKAQGVKLVVNNQFIAIVKDKETAQQILDDIMEQNKRLVSKDSGTVSILSAGNKKKKSATLESAEFMQEVELVSVEIDPNEIVEPMDVIRKLEGGDVAPTKYTVQKGDCLGCIAQKFDISLENIYDNNPWIVDDMIRVGDVLDLTVLQPTLSVRTVEKVVEEHDIQYETKYITDDNLRAGKTELVSPGKLGRKEVTFLLTRINGQLIKEELSNETVLIEPIAAVVKKGTKIIPGEGTGNFSWPVSGAKLTSSYGQRWGAMHKGIDLASSNRTIKAADNGKVIFSGTKNGYGKTIIIDHNNGYKTLYAHMSSLSVSKGDTVEKGEKIGVMGSTGNSTGVHLHFEVHKNGKVQNPTKYLN